MVYLYSMALGFSILGGFSVAQGFELTPIMVPEVNDYLQTLQKISKYDRSIDNRVKAQIKDGKNAKSADDLLELGKAHLNQYILMVHFETEDFQQQSATWNEKGKKGRAPKLSRSQSDKKLKAAQAPFERLLKVTPDHAEGQFYQAYIVALLGDTLCVNLFDDLQEEQPDSEFSAHGYNALGGFFVSRGDEDKARREFKWAKEKGKAFAGLYASFRLAWLDYVAAVKSKSMARKEKALKDFLTVLMQFPKESDALSELEAKVKADAVGLLADLGSAQRIEAVAAKGQDELALLAIERLAYIKFYDGDGKTSGTLFKQLIAKDPLAPANFERSLAILDITAESKSAAAITRELQVIATNYTGDSPWVKANESAAERVKEQLPELLFNWAVELDDRGRKDKTGKTSDSAIVLYRLLERTYPETKHLYQAWYFLGITLIQKKNHLEAARVLQTLLLKFPQGKENKQAADYMITAAQLAIDADKAKPKLPKRGLAEDPEKIPTIQKTYIDAIAIYLKINPAGKNSAAMLYVRGSSLYDYGHYDEAMAVLKGMVAKYPKDPYGKEAAFLILEHYQINKEDDDLADALQDYGKIPGLITDPRFKKLKSGK